MNAMLASGGYLWTIHQVGRRTEYMTALEEASTRGNIAQFTQLFAHNMAVNLFKTNTL
jgi:hypothetical protein